MGEEQRGPEEVDAEEAPSSGGELMPDHFYRALSVAERRRCLWYLLDQSDQSNVRELARVLAGWDATDTGSMSTESDHDAVLVELHHRHLPVLEEADLLEYDHDTGTVSLDDLDETTRNRLTELVARDDRDG